MARSLFVFAFLVLFVIASGSGGVGDRKLVESVKRIEPDTRAHDQIIKPAESAKLSRRQQGGVADSNGQNQGPYYTPGQGPSGNGGIVGGNVGSYSYNSVISVCYTLIFQIQSCQNAIISSGINAQSAMQQVQQLAAQFQAFISQFQSCSPCYASSGLGTFGGLFSRLFSDFNTLVTSCQKYYPTNWTPIFGTTFGGLNDSLANFLSLCQSQGLAVNNFMPRTLTQFWGQVGLTSVSKVLRQYGY